MDDLEGKLQFGAIAVTEPSPLTKIKPVILDNNPVNEIMIYEVAGRQILRGREEGRIYGRTSVERLETFRSDISKILEECNLPVSEVSIAGKGSLVDDRQNKVFYLQRISVANEKGEQVRYRTHPVVGLLREFISQREDYSDYAIVSDGKVIVNNSYTDEQLTLLAKEHKPLLLVPHNLHVREPHNAPTYAH